MENFIITISYLAGGMLLKRMPKFPRDTAASLNLFVIYVSLPALVLLKIPEMQFTRDAMTPVLMPWLMLIFSAVAVFLLARVLKWNREVTGCMLLMVPLGNTSFLGIPMVEAFLGDHAVPYAVLYDQLGSFLALATYGSFILAIYGNEQSKQTWRDIVMKIITFPPFIALVAAFCLSFIDYPDIVRNILVSLSGTLVPIVMIAVGFQLSLRLEPELLPPLSTGLFIKLALAPLMALILCRFSGITGLASDVAIFEAGMPPMVSAGALAILANLSPKLTAAMVGAGIILCFATLPLLYKLINIL